MGCKDLGIRKLEFVAKAKFLCSFFYYHSLKFSIFSNGEGGYSEEIVARTYSDIPADPPQNVTLEPASSTSIIGE